MDKAEITVLLGKDYAGDTKHIQSPELLAADHKGNKKTKSELNQVSVKAQPKRQARHLESQN
jgi:hypothetical protein